jgi:hypothetical protein
MENEITVSKVWLDNHFIYIQTDKGIVKNHPLEWFPKLLNATKEQREGFTLSPFGIHWDSLDEDLSFEGFFSFNKSVVTI